MSSQIVVLDTDFIIDYLAGMKEARMKLIELLVIDLQITTTVVSVTELYRGIRNRKWGGERRKQLETFLKNVLIIPYGITVARSIGQLLSDLDQEGNQIGFCDTAIAGICLQEKAAILTRNTTHFSRISNLKVITY